MCKDSKKNLIGQPIFKQVLNLIPREVVDKVVFEQRSDHYCKSFSTWDELITLLFGVFERCDSAREVCDSMAIMSGKLNYFGMESAPAKSTFNDALNRRSEQVFEAIYFALLAYFAPFLSDSRKEGISFKQFFAFDSTTIRLFSEVLKEDIFFVSRLKDNAKYEVMETFFEQELSDNQSGVMKDEHIHLPLHFFYSESENGIKTQVWATLIAHLLLTVLMRKSDRQGIFDRCSTDSDTFYEPFRPMSPLIFWK